MLVQFQTTEEGYVTRVGVPDRYSLSISTIVWITILAPIKPL